MKTNKTTARLVGFCYIVATLAGVVGIGLQDPIIDSATYLQEAATHENQILWGALFELLMGVAVTGIAISVYPVLVSHHPSLGVGYLSARLVEGVIYIVDVTLMLSLLTLSIDFVDAPVSDVPYFQMVGELLYEARDWVGHVILDVAVFPLGAVLLYGSLYRTKLVPRWLSGGGIVLAFLYWVAGVLVLFAAIEPLSSAQIALQAPLGIQEIVFALWLVIRGFTGGKA